MSAKMTAFTTTFHNLPSTVAPTSNRRLFSIRSISRSSSVWNKASFRIQKAPNVFFVGDSKRSKTKEPSSRGEYIMCAIHNDAKLKVTDQNVSDINGIEPFGGKSGSVSFIGLTHQLIDEGKLVSTPFKENRSLLWVVGPIALISSVLIPQFFGLISEDLLQDVVLTEIAFTATSEIMFYIGLATFLLVTDHVQKPYLQYSTKRWSLITGFRGYLSSAFFVMGFKVIAPLFAAFVTWPLLGLAGVVSVSPYLIGCFVQFIFEKVLEKRQSSCWPLVPIVFEPSAAFLHGTGLDKLSMTIFDDQDEEVIYDFLHGREIESESLSHLVPPLSVYRLYQLSKAMHFMEKLMFTMRGLPKSPELMEKGGALAAMIVTFEVLAVVCIWSFLTFIQRLFPSRPVAENY